MCLVPSKSIGEMAKHCWLSKETEDSETMQGAISRGYELVDSRSHRSEGRNGGEE